MFMLTEEFRDHYFNGNDSTWRESKRRESKRVTFYETFEDVMRFALEKVGYYIGDEEIDDYKVTHFESFKDAATHEYVAIWNLLKEVEKPICELNDKVVSQLIITAEKVDIGHTYIM